MRPKSPSQASEPDIASAAIPLYKSRPAASNANCWVAASGKLKSKPEMQRADLRPLVGQVAIFTGGGRGLGFESNL